MQSNGQQASQAVLENVKLQAKVNLLVALLSRSQQELQELQELQRELDIMRQSTSWRITAPLRAIKRWIKGTT